MKKAKQLKFEIERLQRDRVLVAIESVAVVVFALFTSAILPSLLVRYVYAQQQLFEQPKLLEYIPVAAFAIGAGFGVYALVLSIRNALRTRKLLQELEEVSLMDDMSCCGGNCGCGDENWKELEELESMVDTVLEDKPKKKAASAKPTKKAAKKSSK
jgi:hypothetical protein